MGIISVQSEEKSLRSSFYFAVQMAHSPINFSSFLIIHSCEIAYTARLHIFSAKWQTIVIRHVIMSASSRADINIV